MVFPASSEQDTLEKMMSRITALEREVRRQDAGFKSTILDIDLTDVTIVDDASETSIFSLTIPGNILNDTNGIRITLWGQIKEDAGTTRSMRIRMKYGATTVLDDTQDITNGLTTLRPWVITAFLLADGATNAQEGSMQGIFKRAGDIENLTSDIGTSVEDSTGDLTLEFTAKWEIANANLEFQYKHAIAEILAL